MSTMKEILRQRREQKSAGQTEHPKPAVSATLKYACGHAVNVEKMTRKKCGPCTDAEHAKQKQAKKERKATERAAKGPASKHDPDAGRLPDGSQFHVSYDALRKIWCGVLQLVSPYREFRAEASGVFKLLRLLDRQYREAANWTTKPEDR